MTGLEKAILGLEQALHTPRRHQMWRWLVRQRLSNVKEALANERARSADAWLAARAGHLQRERSHLLGRLSLLGNQVLEAANVEPVRDELLRLLHDIEHHRQRVNDMVYDTVSMEIGGSE